MLSDNLGYADDGEEFVGMVDELKAAAAADEHAVDGTPTKKRHKKGSLTQEGAGQKNTMFSFVKPGLSNTGEASHSASRVNASGGAKGDLDLDSMLKSLDGPAASNGARPTHSAARGYGGYSSRSRPLPQSLAPTVTRSNQDFVKAEASDYDDQDYSGHAQTAEEDYSNGDDAMDIDVDASADARRHDVEMSVKVEGSHAAVKEEPSEAPKSLTSTARKLEAPVPRAKQIADAKAKELASGVRPLVSAADDLMVMSQIGAEGDGGALAMAPASAASHSLDAAWWILKSGQGSEVNATPQDASGSAHRILDGEEYVNMYWIDATESNGVLYLFGKVPVTEAGGEKYFVSCCVAVHGNERNLFVLPKSTGVSQADGTDMRAPLQEVYGDLTKLLVPDIVPRAQGQSFRCKPVKRKYAFEHGDIPRREENYMKVVYSAKYGVPNAAQCAGFGSIERIFGASSSVLEYFLLKRKLIGPGWITIRNPRVLPSSVSWCKLEIGIEDPKFIHKMDAADAPAVPSLTSMAISMKTVVNPASHTHEIVMISALIHTKVDLDADSNLHPSVMRRFTLIRPLGSTCGSNSGYANAFPQDLAKQVADTKGAVISMPNERAMLSMFFSKLLREDPDILVSHNLFGFEFDVLLSRAVANKLSTWSQLGRLRRVKPPKSINDRDVAAGRLLCDTYKASKEFLRETTYSLTYLAQSQLGIERTEIDPVDVPRYFFSNSDILNLASHTASDAFIVQKLLFKLQVVPLTKQLTNLSGNLWSRTLRGARAERIEYLLLHEFHALKYILPEKKAFEGGNDKFSGAKHAHHGDDDDEPDGGNAVGGHSRKRSKAAYAGGLVLEPKKGLYDTFILLLDFNSLYPSLIQEYNLCFTTVDWTKYMEAAKPAQGAASTSTVKAPRGGEDDEEEEEEDTVIQRDGTVVDRGAAASGPLLPPIPDSGAPPGILPRVIKTLVDRRRQVKDLLKNARDPALRQQLDIRQKALKLTANSMYGCLGFSFSRFYARPIAALVTAKGREALQRTVDQAENHMNLDVIYGDTDSVMINTNSTDLAHVKKLGNQVKSEVNKLYKSLELDIDGIFKSMLLLKKKKYAAVTMTEVDGGVVLAKELKGLDLVRRDWCPLSKDTGKYVVDQILSGKPREEIVQAIHEYLADLAGNIRNGNIDLAEFVVTKGLNKSPKDYPDCKGQPHLQVALRMLKLNKPVNIGDHIPYVICQQTEMPAEGAAEADANNAETAAAAPKKSSPAERAFHPDEIFRSQNKLTIDYEWYLTQQILPPIAR